MDIGVGKQQLVEIAKALSQGGEAADPRRADRRAQRRGLAHLLDLILHLKSQGITSIIISHKLNEIKKVADTVTVIRDGKTIETIDIKRRASPKTASSGTWSAATSSNRYPDHTPAHRRGAAARRGLDGAPPA